MRKKREGMTQLHLHRCGPSITLAVVIIGLESFSPLVRLSVKGQLRHIAKLQLRLTAKVIVPRALNQVSLGQALHSWS